MSETISAELSLYPLREADLGPAILEFVDELRQEGLKIQPGSMSTLLVGPRDQVFEALKRAFTAASRRHQIVLRMVISNGCPTSEQSA